QRRVRVLHRRQVQARLVPLRVHQVQLQLRPQHLQRLRRHQQLLQQLCRVRYIFVLNCLNSSV
ncbi:unnamed protein product, partial [Rotaria magnacalcarata]